MSLYTFVQKIQSQQINLKVFSLMLFIARYYAWSDDYDYLLVTIYAIDLSIFNDMICNVIMFQG